MLAENDEIIQRSHSGAWTARDPANAPERMFKVIDTHLYSDLGDEAVILNLSNGKYYGLNAVGVTIWKSLDVPRAVPEIEARVLEEFDVDRDTCHRETCAFLEKMVEEGLVTIENA